MSGPQPVVGADGITRCAWAAAGTLADYHDTEWGLPVRGEQALYERVMLEAFQAGLSWLTILTKRNAFRDAFCGFDPEAVAAFGDADIARLLADSRIVRNQAKITVKAVIIGTDPALRETLSGLSNAALIRSYEIQML